MVGSGSRKMHFSAYLHDCYRWHAVLAVSFAEIVARTVIIVVAADVNLN